jgi:FAD-dependent oxidoreductase domain-containing protein 1
MAGAQSQRVVIIGGAIIGSFAAWFLLRHGYRGEIAIVEKDTTYQYCSTARSAASIRTQFGTPVNIRMSLFGIDFLRGIKKHFGPAADIGYVENGYLILGGPSVVEERIAAVAMQRREGADVIALRPDEIKARFPFLSLEGIGIGTFGPSGEGWFDAWSLLSLVRTAVRELGATYINGEATGLRVEKGRATAVELEGGGELACDVCVLAAGAASGAFMANIGDSLPVSPRKRSVFHFRAPVAPDGFPMLFDSSGIWIRPEGEGFIGGIQPPASEDHDATGDYEPHHHLMDELFWPLLATRIPAMEALRMERSWAGHYEVNTLDHNGIVGPHDAIGNLLLATGFSGHGVMHSPAVGRAIAELVMEGRYSSLDLSPLGFERIREGRPLHESVVY